jgi:hypothetical protein
MDIEEGDWNIIQAAEMKYLRTVKGCIKTDQLRNEDIRNDLGIFPLYENITEFKDKWKIFCNGSNRLEFYFKPINVILPVEET